MRSGDALQDLSRDRPPVPRWTFSISASTTSPGMAPATNTIAPSWRAIMRPPAAGRSIVEANALAAIHSDGNPKCCRTSRWMAARRDCA